MDTLTIKINAELSNKVKILCIEKEMRLKDFVAQAIEKEYSLRCK